MNSTDFPHASSNPSTTAIEELLDEETMKKLSGDNIGDTIFSETFVLETILKLQNVSFDKDFEDNLTFLWDATMESAVCDYLNIAQFDEIACAVIETAHEERLIEILVGILANIVCNGESIIMDEKYSRQIVNLLSSPDHLILIQVFRFLKALAFTESSIDFITSDDILKIEFILNNSRNLELLMGSLDALAKLTMDSKLSANKISAKLALSSIVAHETIEELLEVDQTENDNNFNKDVIKATNYLLGVLVNLLTYEDNRLTTEIEVDSVKIIHYLFSFSTKASLGYEEYITNNQSCLEFLEYVISCFNFICKHFIFKLDNIEDMLLSFSIYNLKVVEKLQEPYDEFLLNFVLNLDIEIFLEKYVTSNCKEEDIKTLIHNVEHLHRSTYKHHIKFIENLNKILVGLNKLLEDKGT